jgi:hypothetical protein
MYAGHNWLQRDLFLATSVFETRAPEKWQDEEICENVDEQADQHDQT